MSWESDLDRWLTTPPEPDVVGECVNCGAELYEGCDYVYDRSEDEWYCDDDCCVQHLREIGIIVTRAIDGGDDD